MDCNRAECYALTIKDKGAARTVILADKIINERKKNGWSQEELAEKLGVSRQAVSKWEGAQSVPDMQRVLDMSRLFGVSCDYLLKDELEAQPDGIFAEAEDGDTPRRVSMEEAQRYLTAKHQSAAPIARGVFLCLLGAAQLVLLAGLGEYGSLPLREDAAGALGTGILLCLVACAVWSFIATGRRLEEFDYLEKTAFETEYGVKGMVQDRKNAYRERYGAYVPCGVAMCITAVLPLLAAEIFFGEGHELLEVCCVSLMLLIIGAAVCLFIICGVHLGSTEVLLQEGDYTREKKKNSPLLGAVAGIYWTLATAGYLGWSFVSGSWDRTWILWPVAGVAFAAVMGVVKLLIGEKD